MRRCSRAAAGAALAPGGFASAASARSWNSNCQGRVNLHSVYRNIVSTPAPGEASYHGQSVERLALPLHEPGGTSTPDASLIRGQLAFSCRWG